MGAIFGAIAALLTSPASGNENRNRLRSTASRGKQKMLDTTEETLTKAQQATTAARNKLEKASDTMANKAEAKIEQSQERVRAAR